MINRRQFLKRAGGFLAGLAIPAKTIEGFCNLASSHGAVYPAGMGSLSQRDCNSLIISTMEKYKPQIIENVSQASPFLNVLLKRGLIISHRK